MNVINTLYEKYLLHQIRRSSENIPEHVTLVLPESDLLNNGGLSKLRSFILWYKNLGVNIISVYVDILDVEEDLKTEIILQLYEGLQDIFSRMPSDVGFQIYDENGELEQKREGSGPIVYMSIGFGGRREITKAVVSILSDVRSGSLRPEDIDEDVIESRLLVRHEPDMVIRAGGKHLSDFLIWQSVYSELYFTDVNWSDIRYMDLLRIIRDYQKRQRRFGK